MSSSNPVSFDSVIFNTNDKTMTIQNGSQGTYSYKDIQRCTIMNEKAKHKGEGIPFQAALARGAAIPGIFNNPYLFVGLKLTMRDGTILAIYTSKEKTQAGTDQYIQDEKEAKKIFEFIQKIIQKYQ